MLFDISFIVLGGGVIEAGEIITNPIRMGIKCALEHKRIVKVTESKLNGVNGVLGIIEIINQYVQNENVVNWIWDYISNFSSKTEELNS